MVSWPLNQIGSGRAHLDLLLQLALEAAEQDLALTGLEAVDDRRNGADVVGHREEDELLVDKVGDGDLRDVVVEEGAALCAPIGLETRRSERVPHLEATQPVLAVVGLLFVKGHVDERAVLGVGGLEGKTMALHSREILFGIGGRAGAQTLCIAFRQRWRSRGRSGAPCST